MVWLSYCRIAIRENPANIPDTIPRDLLPYQLLQSSHGRINRLIPARNILIDLNSPSVIESKSRRTKQFAGSAEFNWYANYTLSVLGGLTTPPVLKDVIVADTLVDYEDGTWVSNAESPITFTFDPVTFFLGFFSFLFGKTT